MTFSIQTNRGATGKMLACILLCMVLSTGAQNPGIKLSYIDSTADPRNDFYTFCNGKWQKTFKLPESDARYGSFNEINENNLKKIKLILDAASANKTAAPNTNVQRLRDFYNTAMDTAKADKLGHSPIAPQLAQIDKIKNIDELMALKSEFDFLGINLFFGSGVSADLKNSKRNVFGINQAGMGMGDRDYYFSDKYTKIREEYQRYICNLFALTGVVADQAAKNAAIVFEFEKNLADKSFTRVQMRDIEKMYNPYSVSQLAELTPLIKWNDFFNVKKIRRPDTVIVGMTEFMRQMDQLLAKTPIENLKLYAKAQLLMEAAPYLSRKFVETSFAFRGMIMSGAKQMKPQWQRTQSTMNGTIGEIVSQEFVKKYFPPEAKVKINILIDNLVAAYRERIASRAWMGEDTKKQANQKLDLLIRKIGYPDKWKDYSPLTIMTDNYWANVCRANKFLTQDNLNDLQKPVDRYKWQMTPVTVNAYYDPTTNEITFPAAILQPPFFDPTAEDAANYGTMGSIIGHELTHGFDDQGSQFDAHGNMKMWWSSDDYQHFKDRTALIVKQFDDYVALDSMHVNGSMTQGENIADLGGLTMAYYAYKKSLAGTKSKVMGGFTGEQRFFIAWAQGWKSITRNEELKRLLTVDYHSPAYFRAFAPLTNMKEFHEAFGVKPGDKMYMPTDKRVEIW
jgi:putative endopeptidase